MKRLIQAAHAPNADAPVKHVRNWGDLLQAQEEKLKEWSRMIQSHLADPEPLANAPGRPVLDILYGALLDILWHADPSLYRHPRVHSQTQPSWWNDECFEALLARNAAWRQRNRAPEMDCTFRSARNHCIVLFGLPKLNIGPIGCRAVATCVPTRCSSCCAAPFPQKRLSCCTSLVARFASHPA